MGVGESAAGWSPGFSRLKPGLQPRRRFTHTDLGGAG
jgi:hypothetical protein